MPIFVTVTEQMCPPRSEKSGEHSIAQIDIVGMVLAPIIHGLGTEMPANPVSKRYLPATWGCIEIDRVSRRFLGGE